MNSELPDRISSVLVIGESLVDVVRTGDTESRLPGGSPMNVAFGLARLGTPTRLLTHFGDDSDGALIREHLESAGVDIVGTSISTTPTSTAAATIEESGSATYKFDIEWSLPPLSGLKLSKWVHVGSLATFLKPGADSLERLLSAIDGQATVSYDPNIRPSLAGERSVAVARFERIARLASVVKMSDEDAQWLYPGLSGDSLVEKVFAGGTKIVALTRGPHGARIASQDHSVEVPGLRVEVADTIGAGDSFMSTMISELLVAGASSPTHKKLEQVASRAVIAAALTCMRPGAQPPTLDELDNVAVNTARRPQAGVNRT